MSSGNISNSSYKKAAALASAAYYWTCGQCRYKNSNYAEKCLSCRAPKPSSSISSASTRSSNTSSSRPPSAFSAKSVTKSPAQSSTSTARSSQPTTRIIPINICNSNGKPLLKSSVAQSASPTAKTNSSNSKFTKANQVNLRNESNKPRSSSVSADKFQEFVIKQQLSPERRAVSTYNVGSAATLSEEALEELKKFIRINSTPISSDRSKTAALLPLLHQTVKEHQSRFNAKLKSFRNGANFEDEGFTKNRSSLYLSTEDSDQMYDRLIAKWLRVKEINFDSSGKEASKQLVVHGANIGVQEFRQGTIGDCWFICSLACLVWHHSGHLGVIIPDPKIHQEGIYQVFFCLDGKWQPIEIDDYFPCDASNRLVFSQTLGNQLFAPILEKALAKHHSCYKALSAGTVLEGFSNITGMPCKRRQITMRTSAEHNALWRSLCCYLNIFKYMVSASCAKNTYGLHANHAYSVLDILTTETQKALLLWNPWGKQELFGSFQQFNQMISKKYSATKLMPGMFWIKFSDFINCFDNLDICKSNTKWNCQRFEFALPFDLADEKNATIFSLDCTKQTHFEFTIYQKVHRDIKFKYRLDLSLVIFKRLRDDSLQFAATSRVFENKVSSFGKKLPPGRYVVAVLGFNHWGQTSRLKDAPKLVLAFHGSRPFTVSAFNSDMHLLGDMLIELALKTGVRKNDESQRWCQYVIKKNFCSFVLVIENNNAEDHLIAEYSSGKSVNAFSIRSSPVTSDIIPPNCRQVIIILSRECDKNECQFETSGKIYRNYVPGHLSKISYHVDIEKMSALFAPRQINADLMVEKLRAASTLKESVEVQSDEEDEETWKPARSRGCCVN